MAKSSKKNNAPTPKRIELGAITTYPLNLLVISELNVRKHLDPDTQSELTASIAAKGLLQQLIGYTEPNDLNAYVCGGQRRLISLNALAEQGRIASDAPIPIRILPKDEALEASLAENLERNDMSPADEFRAFQSLIDTGRYSAQQIADRFGYTKAIVDARLRLNILHPEILAALEAGKFGLESAKAYASVTDAEQQLKIFNAQQRSAYDKHKPASIMVAINSAGIDIASSLGRFIGGAKAYIAAGGTFDESPFDDLFDGTYAGKRKQLMTDGALIAQLFTTKAKTKEATLIKKAAEHFGVKITDIIWSPKPMEGTAPKVPAGSFKLDGGYMYSSGDKSRFLHKVKVAVDAGARVSVIGYLSSQAEVTFSSQVLFITKDGEAAVKAIDGQADSHRGASQEEQEAERRKRQVETRAAVLFWDTLTPEQKIDRTKRDRQWHNGSVIVLTLSAEVTAEEALPFVDEATAAIAKDQAEREEREKREAEEQERARAAALEAAEAYGKALDALAETDDLPEVIVVTLPGYGFDNQDGTITVTRGPEGWAMAYALDDDAAEDETIGELDTMLGLLADYGRECDGATLTQFATSGDYEASIIDRVDEPAPEPAPETEDA